MDIRLKILLIEYHLKIHDENATMECKGYDMAVQIFKKTFVVGCDGSFVRYDFNNYLNL